MEPTRTRAGTLIGGLLAVLLLLLVAYVGSYLALVQRLDIGGSALPPTYFIRYRAGGEWSRRLFSPAHALDRKIRPEYWGRAIELKRE